MIINVKSLELFALFIKLEIAKIFVYVKTQVSDTRDLNDGDLILSIYLNAIAYLLLMLVYLIFLLVS